MQPFSDSLSKSRDDLVNVAASRQQQQQLHYSRRRHHGSSPNLSLDQTDNLRRRWVEDQTYHTYLKTYVHTFLCISGEDSYWRRSCPLASRWKWGWSSTGNLRNTKATADMVAPAINIRVRLYFTNIRLKLFDKKYIEHVRYARVVVKL